MRCSYQLCSLLDVEIIRGNERHLRHFCLNLFVSHIEQQLSPQLAELSIIQVSHRHVGSSSQAW